MSIKSNVVPGNRDVVTTSFSPTLCFTRRLLICLGRRSSLLAAKIIFLLPTIRFKALINDPSKSNMSTTLTIMPFRSDSSFNKFKNLHYPFQHLEFHCNFSI